MQRSSVVLPEPEGPKSAVTPRPGSCQIDIQRKAGIGQREAGLDGGRVAQVMTLRLAGVKA